MARPARVRMRSLKPCVFARLRLFGWNVRFTGTTPLGRSWWKAGKDPVQRWHRSTDGTGLRKQASTRLAGQCGVVTRPSVPRAPGPGRQKPASVRSKRSHAWHGAVPACRVDGLGATAWDCRSLGDNDGDELLTSGGQPPAMPSTSPTWGRPWRLSPARATYPQYEEGRLGEGETTTEFGSLCSGHGRRSARSSPAARCSPSPSSLVC